MYQLVSEYLKSEGAKYDLMNPTIRSKIIYGVASTMNPTNRSEAHYEGTKDDPEKSIGNPIKLAPEIFGGNAYYSLVVYVCAE